MGLLNSAAVPVPLLLPEAVLLPRDCGNNTGRRYFPDCIIHRVANDEVTAAIDDNGGRLPEARR